MTIYEIFSHSPRIRYKTSVCSKATIFYFVSTILTFVPPLLLAYRSQGFWQKISSYREQPDIHFKHKMLLILETNSNSGHIVWSSYRNLNNLLADHVKSRVPLIEHIEEDYDRDGRNDKLSMKIEVPLSNEDIVSVKLLLVFDYKLHLYSMFQMESLAYVHHSSSLPANSFHATGELSLHQRQPLYHRGKDTRFNNPVIDDTSKDIDAYKLENVLSSYSARNVSTLFRYAYPVWRSGRAPNETFKIVLTVIYPEETIQYKVGFWQLIKWALVQYIAILVIFWYIFHHIKIFVFKKQLVPTIVLSPLKKID